jgi:uncharacterized peroxidase-related enzyme
MYSMAYLEASILGGLTLTGSASRSALAVPSLRSRVPLLERGEVPGPLAALYDQLQADGEMVPNVFKALSSVPDLALSMAGLLGPMMAEGFLTGWYKELIAARVASLNHCDGCVSAHRLRALKRGATLGQVASYDTFEDGPFTAKERAGFRYAGLLHQSGHAVNEAAFEDLAHHFITKEILELTAVAAFIEMFSRIQSGLRIPATPRS